jgi:hypothetical protein
VEGRPPGRRARVLLWQEEQPDVGPSGTSRTGHFLLSTDRGAAIQALDVMSPLSGSGTPRLGNACVRRPEVRVGATRNREPDGALSAAFRTAFPRPTRCAGAVSPVARRSPGDRVTGGPSSPTACHPQPRADLWYGSPVLASSAPGPDENAVQTCTGRAPTPSARGRHDARRRDARSRETSKAVSGTCPRTIVGARMGPSTTVRPPSASEH